MSVNGLASVSNWAKEVAAATTGLVRKVSELVSPLNTLAERLTPALVPNDLNRAVLAVVGTIYEVTRPEGTGLPRNAWIGFWLNSLDDTESVFLQVAKRQPLPSGVQYCTQAMIVRHGQAPVWMFTGEEWEGWRLWTNANLATGTLYACSFTKGASL